MIRFIGRKWGEVVGNYVSGRETQNEEEKNTRITLLVWMSCSVCSNFLFVYPLRLNSYKQTISSIHGN